MSAGKGKALSTIEIVVLVVALLMFGGLGAILVYVERPEKAGKEEAGEHRPR